MNDVRPSTAHDALLRDHERAPTDESRTALLAAMTVHGDRAADLTELGHPEAARRALEVALRLGEAAHPRGAACLVPHHTALAEVLEGADPTAAEIHYRRALENESGRTPTLLGARIRARLAALLHREGRLSEAEPLYLDALAILESDGGPSGHAAVAVLANNLATLLWQSGRTRDAIERAEWAVAILGSIHAPGDEALVRQQIDLATILARSGRPDEATALYRSVLEHQDSGEAWLGLAEALAIGEHLAAALHAYEHARARLSSLGDRRRAAEGQARALVASGRLDEALAVVDAERRSAGASDSRLTALLGELLERGGRFEDAEARAAERGDAMARGRLLVRMGRLVEAEAVLLTGEGDAVRIALAEVRRALGRAREAERDAIAIAPDVIARGDEGASDLAALAALFRGLGRLEEAERLFRLALGAVVRSVGLTHPDAGPLLDELVTTVVASGRPAEADVLAGHGLVLAEQTLGADHPVALTRRLRRAEIQATSGRIAEARALLEETELSLLAHRPTAHPDRARLTQSLAVVHEAAGHLHEAESERLSAVRAHSAAYGHEHPEVGADWAALARLRARRGRLAEAHTALDRAIAVEELELRRSLLHGGPPARRAALARARASTADAITLHLRGRPLEVSSARLALRTILVRRGRDVDLSRDILAPLRADPGSRATLTRLRDLSARRAALHCHVPIDADEFEAWQRELAEVEAHLAGAERDAVDALPGDPGSVHVGVGAVAAALGPRRALLELVEYRPRDFDTGGREAPRVAAYLLRDAEPGPTIAARDLGLRAAIDDDVRTLRGDLRTGRDPRPGALTLSRRVLDPLQDELTDLDELVVACDVSVALVPLELVLEAAGTDLVLRRVTAGRDLLRPRSSPSPGPPLMVEEPTSVAEVANRDLGHAGVAILGSAPDGADVAAVATRHRRLRRALVAAGSRSQLLPLWPVDREATRIFLEALGAELGRGQVASNAVATARRALRQDPRFSDPGHWAAFALSGVG